MAESMYPECGKCGKGTLLPFFNRHGENIYVCTKCCATFGPTDEKWIGVGDFEHAYGYLAE